jgi:hypothetical protein
MALAEAVVKIVPDFSGFGEQTKQGVQKALDGIDKAVDQTADNIEKEFKESGAKAEKAVDGIGGEFKKLGKLIAGAAIGKAVKDFAKASIDAASDLEESINAVQVTYGELSGTILDFGQVSAKTVGLAAADFNSFAVRFAGFTKQIATGGKSAADVTIDLTKRIADFASVMNLDLNEAATVFGSTLAGESEAIRRFGIDMSAASIEAFALSTGLIKSKDEMTAGIKVQATYAKLMADTAQVANDFANTSDSLANRQRILSAEFKDMQVVIGQALVPVLSELLGIAGSIMSAFVALPEGLQKTIAVTVLAGGAFIALSSTLQGVGLAAKTANVYVAGFMIALTLAGVIYSALKSRGEAARKAQEDVTAALIAADEPAYVLSARLKSLVEDYKTVTDATEDAESGITVFNGALDATRAAVLKFTPAFTKAGVSLEDVAKAAAAGSDSFDGIAEALLTVRGSTDTTANSFATVERAIVRNTEVGDPMRQLLLDLAQNGGLTVEEFRQLVQQLDLTSDGFDKSRETLNKQNEAFLTSTEAVTDFTNILGGDVYAELVKNAEATATAAGRTDEFTFLVETLNAMLFEQGWTLDTTTNKLVRLDAATGQAATGQDDLAGATGTTTSEIEKQEKALDRLIEATLAMFNSEIQLERAKRQTGDAIEEYNALVKSLEDGTYKGSDAYRDLAVASEEVRLASLNQAGAQVKLAEDIAATAEGSLGAEEKQRLLREELILLAKTLDPNSPLRKELDRYIGSLKDVPTNVTTRIHAIYTDEDRRTIIDARAAAGTQSGMGSGRPMANGGIVTSATRALIGEAGPEVIIPLTRPARALELMQESGLIGMAAFGRGMVGSSKATVNIEQAVFNNGTDANLVAQKVNAAERARSFGS